jgi:hypothetical protein
MDRLSLLLPKVLHRRGLKVQADASLIVFRANEWLKENGASEDILAIKLKEGTLFLSVESPVAAQECHALSEDLLLALHKEYPAVPLKSIRIARRIGEKPV